MPTYCLTCDACARKEEVNAPMGGLPQRWPCKCGKPMRRDYAAEGIRIHGDPETTSFEIDKNLADRYGNVEVRNNLVSRSLADVPGARTQTLADGKRYAVFSSHSDRRKTLKRMGINES
jgi:hypothetical protein